jgi:hypothetical protein
VNQSREDDVARKAEDTLDEGGEVELSIFENPQVLEMVQVL